jgi:hypothetical protein
MKSLASREEFRARRRRAIASQYLILAVVAVPMIAIIVAREAVGPEELFPFLQGKARAIPYAAALGFFFVGLIWPYSRVWKRAGLVCDACGHAFASDVSFQVVISTGCCGGCGKLVLDNVSPVMPNNSLQRP